MKFVTTVALLALIGVAASQVISGAKQCVECSYWGGNWCPATGTAAPSTTSGVCRTDVTTCSTGTLATSPNLCVAPATTHASRVDCTPITISGATNATNYTTTLAFNTYCVLNVTVTGTNLTAAGVLTPSTTTSFAVLQGNPSFEGTFVNSTLANAFALTTVVMSATVNGTTTTSSSLPSTVSILMWNYATSGSVTVSGTYSATVYTQALYMAAKVAAVIASAAYLAF